MNIEEIAKKMAVSVSTVSRALNPSAQHLVAAPTRQKIQIFAKAIKFVPNRSAQELVSGRTQTIGVLLSTMHSGPFYSENLSLMLCGIYDALQENPAFKCRLMILPKGVTVSMADAQDLRAGVDGLLISSQCDSSAENVRHLPDTVLQGWDKPVVILNLEPKSKSSASLVSFSNVDAACLATTHLIQRDRRQIGFIYGNMDFEDSLDRFDGYKKALADHHLPFREDYLVQGHYNADGGYRATLELLNKTHNKIEGLFCANDQMAFGCLKALKALGIKCPGQIAVIGLDGLHIGEYVDPPLTTVAQPTKDMAINGTRLLLDLIQKRIHGPVNKTVPCRLLIRGST